MKNVLLIVFFSILINLLCAQNYTFSEINSFVGLSLGSTTWGDYDNDGDQDLLITGYTGSYRYTYLYRNDVGIFNLDYNVMNSLTDVGNYSAVSWGDFDNDGDLDLLLAGYDGYNENAKVYIFQNGVVTNSIYLAESINNPAVTWCDFDNDGYLDILMTGINSSSTRISKIYRFNSASYTFSDVNAGLTGVDRSAIACGDYDNDGYMDFILTGDNGSSKISKMYHNNGNLTFTDIVAGITGVYQSSVAWGDYNNDGYIDLLITGYTGSTTSSKVYRNNGNGTFTDIGAGLQIMDRSSVAWGDYDNDGDLDILMSGQNTNSNRYTKLYNNNNGIFSVVTTTLPQLTDSSVSFVDFDNDGDLDIFLMGYNGSSRVTKLFSNSGGSNHWLKIRTRGIQSNADGNGAKITIYPNFQSRFISNNNNCIARNAHFGIGSTTILDSVVVYWPKSGIRDVLTQVSFNQSIFKYEGDYCAIIVLPSGPLTIPAALNQNHSTQITWSIDGTAPPATNHVTLLYSTDSGVTFPNLISDNEVNDGSYTWFVPNLNSSTVRIKVELKNSSNVVLAVGISSRDIQFDNIIPNGLLSANPTNGSWASNLPLYTWQNAISYNYSTMDIIVDDNDIVSGINCFLYQYQTPTDSSLVEGWHTYYYKYYDYCGNWAQTAAVSFRVDATNPAQFSLVSPLDSSWLDTKSPTFSWTASTDNGSGLAKYQLYLNNTLKKDNIAPNTTQWTASSGSFSENAEAGMSYWVATGTWGLTNVNPHSGSYCITDSPTGNYPNNNTSTLTLAQPIALQNVTSLSLSLWYHCLYTWSNADHTYLEISNNGTSWTQIGNYTDSNETLVWTQSTYNLNSYISWSQIYIRFRMSTDAQNTEDGFYFDDMVLTASGCELPDGNYVWMAKAIDNVGNVQQSTDTRNLHIDTTAPHGISATFANLTPANNFWTADSLITFTWVPCVDDGVGFNHYELWIDGANISGNITNATYTLTSSQILPNGNHTWYVKTYDGLGNYATSTTSTLRIDRIAPADFALLTPVNGSYFIMPTPNFSWNSTTDAGCGLSHYELWIDNLLSIDNLTQTSTSPSQSLSEGSHSWKVYAVDNVGNRKQSAAIWTTIGDWNPPTQCVIISPINNEIVPFSRPIFSWNKSTDAGTGVNHYSLYIDNVQVVASYVPTDMNAQVVTLQSPNPLVNGTHNWYVKAFDNAGGESSSAIGLFSINIDITAPTSTISNPIANQYIGGDSYLITGSSSDNTGGTGVQRVEISFDGGNTWFNTTNNSRADSRTDSYNISSSNKSPKRSGFLQEYNPISLRSLSKQQGYRDSFRDIYNWQFTWTGYQTGSVTIKTRAIDYNNNVETPPNSMLINIERILPVVQAISIIPTYSPAGTTTFSIAFQTGSHCGGMNNSVSPTVTITPAGGTGRPVTQTNFQGNTWTGQTSIAQSDLNGTAVIRVSNAKDNINNIMILDATHTFVIDTVAPNAFNLITPANNAWLNQTQPQLTWGAATDATSGIDHYALEIDGSTNSPGINNIPATSNTIQPATPLTTGAHTWRIKAIDRAGNFTWSSSTFNFTLDINPPLSLVTSPSNNSTIGGLAFTIAGTSSDGTGPNVSNVANVQIKINNGSWLNVVNTGTNFSTWTYSWTGYTAGTYTIQSKATDTAGNIETSPLTTTVNVNLSPPTVQTITIAPNPAKVGTVTCTAVFVSNSSGLNYSVHPTLWFTTPNASIVNFTETSYSGNQWIGTATIASTTQNGMSTVHVTGVIDNYNNTMVPNQNAGTFVIDTVAPTVSSVIVTPQITNIRTDLSIQVNFATDTAGLNSAVSPVVTILPLGASASDYIEVTQTGYNVTTRTWTGVATINSQSLEGAAAIKVASTADLAGNVMQVTTLQNQLVIDRSAPLPFNILQPLEGTWTSNRQPQINWSPSSDAVSGLLYYKLLINDEQVGSNIPPTSSTITIQTSLPDAGYSVRLAAYDNAQSPNIQLSGTSPTIFHVDGTAPVSTITSPTNGFVVQGNSITVTGTAIDGIVSNLGIGVRYVLLSQNGGANWDSVYVATEQAQGSVDWNYTYGDLIPGNHTLLAKSIDWLGNVEIPNSTVLISVQAVAPVANFSATPLTGVAPLSVAFTDLSTSGTWPITIWQWDFNNDGMIDSNEQNPNHVFARGIYTVVLTASDAYNTTNTITMANMINVTNQAPYTIQPMPDLAADEDFTPIVINLSDYFADDDGDNLTYSVSHNSSEVSAIIDNHVLTINPVLNYYGTSTLTITADDQFSPVASLHRSILNNRDTCTDSFVLTINSVNDAPVINSFSPTDTTITLEQNEIQAFSVNASDVEDDISYSWYVNGVNQNVSSNTFEYQFTSANSYEVKVAVTDSIAVVEQIWAVFVSTSNDDNVTPAFVTQIYPVYPNPFRLVTNIEYSLSKSEWVTITITNTKGQLIKELTNKYDKAGLHSLIWNGTDGTNSTVSSGIYFINMRYQGKNRIQKVVLVK
jgi:hypothetical protein